MTWPLHLLACLLLHVAADVLFVAAAGNERVNIAGNTSFPAGYVGRYAYTLQPRALVSAGTPRLFQALQAYLLAL